MDIKSIECGRSNREEGQDWSKLFSATKDVVSGTNGYSGKSLEMRKRLCCVSMERELHMSRKEVQELLMIPKVLMGRFKKWTDLNCFFSVRIGEERTCSFFL